MEIHLIDSLDKENPMDNKAPSLGLGYLASYAEKYGGYKDIRIYSSGENITFEKNPDVVGISSVTQNFNITKAMIKRIRKISKDTIIILGGTHITMLPQSAPLETDFIVIGEGEQTFLELLDHIFRKKRRIEDIKGIYYKKGGRFVSTGPRELIHDLDIIPFPKREGIDYSSFEGGNSAHIITSRGCPYRCPFCSSSSVWKGVRFHSADYVIRELEMMINKYNIKTLSFADDLFIANKPRLIQITQEIIKKGWHNKISFMLHVRANLVDEEMVGILKSIKTKSVGIGIESGSPRILKILKCGTVTVEQNYRAVRLLREAGIKVGGYFMMGYPGETVEDIHKTMEFIKKSNVDTGQTMIAIPYPGTELWKICIEKGIVSEDMDWNKVQSDFEKDVDGTVIVSEIDRKELFRLYMKFREYWLYKHIQSSGSILNYIRRLDPVHFLTLVRQPRKNIYVIKAIFDKILHKSSL